MSTLHKQNFDLKLELFHRRERQTVLEQTIEKLEDERTEAEQTNGKLVQELEKRDKAVEEAVHMIVSLEARMELLLREREMVRQLEADKALTSQHNQSPSSTLVNSVTTPKPHDEVIPNNNKRGLARMPSFLSERTENTENLRNVYLDTKTSLLSLSKTDSRLESNGFVSPSMSILSESSFLSIYGQRAGRDSSSPPDLPHSIQSRLGSGGQRSVSMPSKDFTPSRSHRSETMENKNTASPLQTLMGPASSTEANGHIGSQTATPGKNIERSTTVRPIKPQPLVRVRKEKDRPIHMRKTIVDEQVATHHALPPTPDTMTSSMLNQSQNSDDTPRRDQNPEEQRYPSLSRTALDQKDQAEPGHWRFKSAGVAQPPSITAFTGRQDISGAACYESRLPALRRPRSADETTISRHKNDWDSCSEDDLCSEASSFDYWMREGLQPSRSGTKARTLHHTGLSSQNPPDLFGFPSDADGWQSHDMFGALGGSGYLGIGAPLAPTMDAIGSSLPAPETGIFGSGLASPSWAQPTGSDAVPPPAPYRRSSLHARTSAPGTPMTARTPGSHGKYHQSDADRKRSVSGHVPSSPNPNGWPMPNTHNQAAVSPVRPQTQQQDKSAEKRHYPPHASQPQGAPRPRSRGITSLFRRSLGSATGHLQPSASVPATHSPFSPPATKDAPVPTVGIPAWERRNNLLDNGASATPPPILRNRGPTKTMNVEEGQNMQGTTAGSSSRVVRGSATPGSSIPGLGAGLNAMFVGQEGGAPLTPTAKDSPAQDNNPVQNQGHGRKWFGLGRVTNLRTGGT